MYCVHNLIRLLECTYNKCQQSDPKSRPQTEWVPLGTLTVDQGILLSDDKNKNKDWHISNSNTVHAIF